jgi:limonene-1,2-epoxide hydrolase
MDAERVVRAFVDAWNALDWERIYALMSPDIVYHNMPMRPVTGIAAVRAGFAAWPVDACEWELLAIATSGDVVLTERVDRFRRGADRIVVPVMGAFEVRGGLITHWRDYFDKGAMAPRAG